MLAGAGGIDAVLLVVAADERVMPQTREHLSIVEMLGITSGVAALTKIDRVTPAERTRVLESLREFLDGSKLRELPIVPVSAKTGEGLDDLRQQLSRLSPRPVEERVRLPFRLPIDRVFAATGFGAVVTGSLVAGQIAAEERVVVLPEGLPARVRRIEIHGEPVESAIAGSRTSLNLAGVDVGDLRRGQVVARPETIEPSSRLLVSIQILPDAPEIAGGAELNFHHFSLETSGRLRLFGRRSLKPGESAAALLSLAEPATALPSDRFVLRRPSPAATIGGGVIGDTRPPARLAPADLEVFTGFDRDRRLARRIERSSAGMGLDALARSEGIAREAVAASATRLIASGAVRAIGSYTLLDSRRYADLRERARRNLAEGTGRRVGTVGLPRAAFSAAVFRGFSPDLAEALLRAMASEGVLDISGDEVRVAGSRQIPTTESKLADTILTRYVAAGFDPPSPAAVARDAGAKEKIVDGLVAFLVKERKLARLPGGIVIAEAVVESVIEKLRRLPKKEISVADFKEMFGLTRRLAIPLLEALDERKVTRRVGEARQILSKT